MKMKAMALSALIMLCPDLEVRKKSRSQHERPFSMLYTYVYIYIYIYIHRGVLKLGVPFSEYHFGGPNNKDCSILGSILASPTLGNYHTCVYVCVYIYI